MSYEEILFFYKIKIIVLRKKEKKEGGVKGLNEYGFLVGLGFGDLRAGGAGFGVLCRRLSSLVC